MHLQIRNNHVLHLSITQMEKKTGAFGPVVAPEPDKDAPPIGDTDDGGMFNPLADQPASKKSSKKATPLEMQLAHEAHIRNVAKRTMFSVSSSRPRSLRAVELIRKIRLVR